MSEFKFTGWFIPRSVVELFNQEILSHSELILLSLIDSLCSGDGCFASNETLGKKCRMSSSKVANCLVRFRKLGLVKQGKFDGRKRHLIVTYNKPLKASALPTQVRQGSQDGEVTLTGPGKAVLLRSSNNYNTNYKLPPEVGNGVCGFLNTKELNNVYSKKASKLIKALASKRMIMRKPSISKWAAYFKSLHHKDKVPMAEIDNVLDWYCDNVGKKFIPRCCSAKSFCERFDTLFNHMQWKDEEEVKQNPEKVELTSKETEVLKFIKAKGWPSKTMQQLPFIIHQSCINHLSLKQRTARLLRAAKKKHAEGTVSASTVNAMEFLQYLQQSYSGGVESWVENWLLRAHASVKGWKQWSGDLTPYLLSLESKHYVEFHRNLCLKWCGNTDAWETIMGKLTK